MLKAKSKEKLENPNFGEAPAEQAILFGIKDYKQKTVRRNVYVTNVSIV